MDEITPAVSWHRKELDYPIGRIHVRERRRPLRPERVQFLADSMAHGGTGQLQPVVILPDGSLVAGNHRLAAAKLLGWESIRATIVQIDELDAELAEIDENLVRTELTVLEQAQHYTRRDEILRAKGLRSEASPGTNQHSVVGAPGAPTITTATMAAQAGYSERAAQERLQIGRGVAADVQAQIADLPIANSTKNLLALARLDAETQQQVAALLTAGRAERVADALGILEDERRQQEPETQVKSAENGSQQRGAELAKCRVCKRPLSDPAHAAAGIGPCCAAKQAAGGEDTTESPQDAQEAQDGVLDAKTGDDTATGNSDVPVSFRDDYDSNEWYTPAIYIEAARTVLGEIELDPASCSLANTVVQAERFIDKAHDGLRLPWCTGALWLNPPYSATQEWVDKLIEEFDGERTDAAIILVNNATETRWFQALLRRFPVCFPASRLAFWRHDHANVGARQGQTFFLLSRDGRQVANFYAVFGQFGPVLSIR